MSSAEAQAAVALLGQVELSISDARETVRGWSGINITRNVDAAADTFSFRFPWNPTEANRSRFRAYRTSIIQVRHKGRLIISGRMEKLSPSFSESRRDMVIEGRSESGVLVDVSAPPIEMTADFNTIARRLSPAGVRVSARPNPTGLFVDVEAGSTVYQVISRLAAGRGLWAQPQSDGSLVFSKITAGPTVANITEGESPIVGIATSHDLTARFYRYTALGTEGGDNTKAEELDTGVDANFRDGKIVQVQHGADVTEAARFARSRGIMDSYTCNISVAGWTRSGEVWAPGDIVEVFAPSAMIYRPYKFMVRRVSLQLDSQSGAVSELDLTFPEVFSGGVAAFPYPWSIIDE